MKRLRIFIYGKVQGVFFRASAVEKALELGLTGFTRNEDSGAVYCEVQGPEEKLNVFLNWCRQGPEHARVDDLEYTFEDQLKTFVTFKTER